MQLKKVIKGVLIIITFGRKGSLKFLKYQ